jgi:hypothetical protein
MTSFPCIIRSNNDLDFAAKNLIFQSGTHIHCMNEMQLFNEEKSESEAGEAGRDVCLAVCV